jgi:hypothetical protein
MAKFEIKFFDCTNETDNFIIDKPENVNLIRIRVNNIEYWFDKSTSIKMAKTLRTEINKITESEGKDGETN